MNPTTWQYIYASVIGLTHRNREEPCQDASLVRTITVGQRRYLIACCSDGAGTAYLAAQGARLACRQIVERAAKGLQQAGQLQAIRREDVAAWIHATADKLRELAQERHAEIRETACTILLTIAGEQQALFAQIGDGAIVLNQLDGRGYDVVFWPQMGEYAGMTNFITDRNAASSFMFQWMNRPIDRLAMFTDGLQMLGLDFTQRAPHTPFFDPLFQTLDQQSDMEQLQQPLQDFLASEHVDARTDDDRTLILAMRSLASDTPSHDLNTSEGGA